jgi:hypothetical protein
MKRDLQLFNEHPAQKDAPDRKGDTWAPPISGRALSGESVALSFGEGRPDTLLAFLSSSCLVCQEFWDDIREERLPAMDGVERLVIVTKGLHEESPSKLRRLAPPSTGPASVIASSEAWEAYSVPGAPYFIYVEGTHGTILGEGSALGWHQIESLMADAAADATEFGRTDGSPGDEVPMDRRSREDAELADAGIGPGHRSLYDVEYALGLTADGREGRPDGSEPTT